MVIAKCTICNKGFRATRAKETLCAACEVSNQPEPSSPSRTDEEFKQFAEEIYGENPKDAIQVNDVFNHESRLKALSSKLENVKDSKERTRRKRDIQRTLEEHEAIQKKLADMQNRFLQTALFTPALKPSSSRTIQTTATTTTTTTTSQEETSSPGSNQPSSFSTPVRHDKNNNRNILKNDDPDSGNAMGTQMGGTESPVPSQRLDDEILLASPVKQTAAFFEMAAKRSSVLEDSSPKSSKKPFPSLQNIQITKILGTLNERRLLKDVDASPSIQIQKANDNQVVNFETIANNEDPDELPEGEPTPQLSRSNSVRNRIKAFEAISRRASTGSWDRKASPGMPGKKVLQF